MKDRILIVEDNVAFREMLEFYLSKTHDVKTAENGLDAILQLQNGYMPDLIVSNYVMPIIDGKTMVLQIKESVLFRHIPVIIMSNINISNVRLDLIKAGVSDFLVKPISLTELELSIKRLLKVAKDESKLFSKLN